MLNLLLRYQSVTTCVEILVSQIEDLILLFSVIHPLLMCKDIDEGLLVLILIMEEDHVSMRLG